MQQHLLLQTEELWRGVDPQLFTHVPTESLDGPKRVGRTARSVEGQRLVRHQAFSQRMLVSE
ncbi:MAG: hypothetical protein WBV06_03140, partial [Acidimicrobiia bacterium]